MIEWPEVMEANTNGTNDEENEIIIRLTKLTVKNHKMKLKQESNHQQRKETSQKGKMSTIENRKPIREISTTKTNENILQVNTRKDHTTTMCGQCLRLRPQAAYLW